MGNGGGVVGALLSPITDVDISAYRAGMKEDLSLEDALAVFALGDRLLGRLTAYLRSNGGMDRLYATMPPGSVRKVRTGAILLGEMVPDGEGYAPVEIAEEIVTAMVDGLNQWVYDNPELVAGAVVGAITSSPVWGPPAAEGALVVSSNPFSAGAAIVAGAGSAAAWGVESFSSLYAKIDSLNTDVLSDLVVADEHAVTYAAAALARAPLLDAQARYKAAAPQGDDPLYELISRINTRLNRG